MAVTLGFIAVVFLPPLLLLLFYARGKTRLIWLTVPITALAAVLPAFALYLAVVSAAAVATAFIKKKRLDKNDNKAVAVLSVILCVIALGAVAHNVLVNTSDGYRQIFDRRAFAQLIEIQPADVAGIEVILNEKEGESALYTDYHGDKAFFADLEYIGSLLSRPAGEFECGVSVLLADGGFISFSSWKGNAPGAFQVQYQNRAFWVSSPQLLADISQIN